MGEIRPGVHALLIGVSDYPALPDDDADPPVPHHLGLIKLASPALTVHRIHQWLLRRQHFLPRPLATCRVLVSPSPGEVAVSAALGDVVERARRSDVVNAIIAWRRDLSRHPDNIGLFYFAGHGVKRERRDDVLLLEEFGSNENRILQHAIDTTSLIDGMAPSKQFPNIARTQLYFFDACRVQPKIFRDYETVAVDPIWDTTVLSAEDNRSMLVIYTTLPGAEAYGPPNDQSLFSRALIRCLDGTAAESFDPAMRDWAVTATSLAGHIATELDSVNIEYKRTQNAEVGRTPKQRIALNRLERPPEVTINLTIAPVAARDYTQVQVLDGKRDRDALALPFPVDPIPFSGTLDAGLYRIVTCDPRPTPEWAPQQQLLCATPQILDWPLEISPLKDD